MWCARLFIVLLALVTISCEEEGKPTNVVRGMIEGADSLEETMDRLDVNYQPFADSLQRRNISLEEWSQYLTEYKGKYKILSTIRGSYSEWSKNGTGMVEIVKVQHSGKGYGAEFVLLRDKDGWVLVDVMMFGTVEPDITIGNDSSSLD